MDRMVHEIPFFNNQGRDISLYTEEAPTRTRKDQLWAFVIKGVVTFFWHSGTLILEYLPEENFTSELLQYWCLHIVMPVFFTVEERYDFLHAGAVAVAGKPILFIADSFGGKSTMTDFFMRQGHPMLSDDKVAICEKDGKLLAVPSYPYHRPYRQEEDMGLRVKNFVVGAKPVHAVYELEKAEAGAAVAIAELSGVEKFVALRRASETNLYFLKPQRLACLGEIAQRVPVFKVKVPWQIKRLSEVYRAIVCHSQNI